MHLVNALSLPLTPFRRKVVKCAGVRLCGWTSPRHETTQLISLELKGKHRVAQCGINFLV